MELSLEKLKQMPKEEARKLLKEAQMANGMSGNDSERGHDLSIKLVQDLSDLINNTLSLWKDQFDDPSVMIASVEAAMSFALVKYKEEIHEMAGLKSSLEDMIDELNKMIKETREG